MGRTMKRRRCMMSCKMKRKEPRETLFKSSSITFGNEAILCCWTRIKPASGSSVFLRPRWKKSPNPRILMVLHVSLNNPLSECLLNVDIGLSSGCAHSSSLSSALVPLTNPKHTSTSPSRPISNIGEINSQTFSANATIDTRLLVTGSEDSKTSLASYDQYYIMTDIYPRLLAAISHTISHSLSQARGLLLIGACTCVDVRTLGDHAYEYLELGLATAGTAIVSSTVRWLSSGTLLFALSGDTLPRLSTLGHACSSRQTSSTLPLGASLLLSPSGVVGHFQGIETTPKDHPLHRSREEIKSSIASDLMLRGISMPAKPQWAMVLVEANKNERESKGETAPETFHMKLWPAHLCLCKDIRTIVGNLGTAALPGFALTSAGDPLAKAQDWFIQKPARAEALKARRLQDQAEAERLKEAADVKDEDIVSDFESQIDRDITPRDVSGIYPTPPDGLPSTANDSAFSNEPNSEANADESNGGMVSNGMHQSYEERRKDDLFEGMDIDLFATNGLTEDDFSFFDEPSLRGENEHDNAGATFPSDPFTFEEPVIASTSILPFDEHLSPTLEASNAAQQVLHLGAGNASENSGMHTLPWFLTPFVS